MPKLPMIDKLTPGDLVGEFAYARHDVSFYLGDFHPDLGASGQAAIDDDRHIFVLAGTRAGKGTSMLIPNLLRWGPDKEGRGGGAFVIDPKGENAAITACARGDAATAKKWNSSVTQFMDQKVAILDPLGVVQGPARAYCVDYNPFIDVDIDDEDGAAGEMETICEAVVMQDEGNGQHFTETASIVLAGLSEWALKTQPRETVTWPFIKEFLLSALRAKEQTVSQPVVDADGNPVLDENGQQKTKVVDRYNPFIRMLENVKDSKEGLAVMAAAALKSAGPREFGSIITTLLRQLKWLNDQRMSAHLEARDSFSLKKAIQENWTVYVCIPPAMINRFRRWLRLIVAIALDAKTQSPFEHEGPQTLFVLDEFAALGTFSQIEHGASNLAGYGVKLVTIIQNIGQLQNTYRDNWETFLGNAGAIIAWGLNDKASEEYISDRIGLSPHEVPSVSMSYSQRPAEEGDTPKPWALGSPNEAAATGNEGYSSNISIQTLPSIWPHEVRSYGARSEMRGFVITAEGKTFPVRRVPYYKDNTKSYDSPDFIREWEESLAINKR